MAEVGFRFCRGGVMGTSNRTSTNSPITGWDIQSEFVTTTNPAPSPPFPLQVDSEFGLGPLIHNRFGTIAMALETDQTNYLSSAFFFNLADNSSSLDGGDFTVFGRILDGSNALEYFNGLTNGAGIVTTDIFSDNGTLQTNPFPLDVLPVNYTGSALPANANLVYCDFLVTNPPVDTNPPTVAITSPAPNAVLTNLSPVITGTASDDVALANVRTVLIPQAATDGTYPNDDVSITNFATGTSNWSSSVQVPPGVYQLTAQSQDGAGNLSAPAVQPLTNSVVYIVGNGTVTYFSNNAVGYPFQDGQNYNLVATPATNGLFASWTADAGTSFSNNLPFEPSAGFVVTATFISNTMPNSISFTYPPPNGIIGTNPFNITGTISNAPVPPVTVTCQIVSLTTYAAAGPILTNVGATNWSVAVDSLPVDSYEVEAIAVDQASNTTLITENFTVATNADLQLTVVGPGTVSGATNGEPIPVGSSFQVTAAPDGSGDLFFAWGDGTNGSWIPRKPM